MPIDPNRPFHPLSIAILTASDTRTPATDSSGDLAESLCRDAGHRVAARVIVRDDLMALRGQFQSFIDDPDVDVVIATGGTGVTGRDVCPEAMAPLVSKAIPGFGELFRQLSYAEIGSSTIQSRAEAAVCSGTLIFLLPGSRGGVRLGLQEIVLPQLDSRNRPCSLAELLPRIRNEH
ncbi:molybdenum cofactor synthesis domain-containing protein [Acidithiobacillus sp.]|uniref:molybdenum cofactor synthesis domain-containing protein n=1 Tax=Acidithiobacillus sp. TaxID=1872118 RepID=UPI0025C395FF|nr:molybdenum cofactor synthesis domain-containing protein [Acidithiobacillus sp.]